MSKAIDALRKHREHIRKIASSIYLKHCRKILAKYKGPGGAGRYKTLEEAKEARRVYLKAYATVWARTSQKAKVLRAKRDKKRKKPTNAGDVREFYDRVFTSQIDCAYCGKHLRPHQTTVDHYVPLSRGGKHEVNNLRYSCLKCNIAKGDKLLGEWEKERAKCSGTSLSC